MTPHLRKGNKFHHKKKEKEARLDGRQQQLGEKKRLFYFCIFQKKLQKYIFGFRFYSSIPLPPGRGRQGACRPAEGR